MLNIILRKIEKNEEEEEENGKNKEKIRFLICNK